ncbi:hypothetical protein HBO23_03670 [Pseudomonas sp. WS 5532]|uniref:hypothetical protein n=1 Tax=unclassified Pseudomonas TaxID=196821 RepID=UPI001472A68A|nr:MULTISPECIES: hypothetical protein [unclassified Pseudomonas]MDL2189027.1 hypothetical protein [Pseudomonas sp. ChxA]NMX72049.1 hypothetical protein [Pseudomonas sp. WS 5532]
MAKPQGFESCAKVTHSEQIFIDVPQAFDTCRGGVQVLYGLITGGDALPGAGADVGGVDHTYVEGNVNNGNAADIQIDLVGHIAFTASDFVGVV